MGNKTIQQMTNNEEILRQQLQLLAERSQNATNDELVELSKVMIVLYTTITPDNSSIL